MSVTSEVKGSILQENYKSKDYDKDNCNITGKL